MEIVITGASGFVGSNLKKYLESSHDLINLSIRYSKGQKIELNGDVVIHLAGKAHDLKKVSIPEEYYEANFELTKQLFDAFLTSKASVFIFMSTVKAVADKVEGILTEENVPNPKTHYGIAKNQAEQYILSKELPEGKRSYILRPCMIHGPGNKGNLNLLYKLVAKGIPWPLGAFQNQRSFLSIENLCFVAKELIENESIPSGIYQVADNQPMSTNQLILLLGESLEKKSRILKLSKNVITSIAKLGDVLNLPLNSERLQKLTENYVVSNDKIISAMGKSMSISAEEGLKKTFMSFKK
ncbi:NAD-dependent epimerase/dehydratase family protein [Flavobacterium sp. SORGH_AS_0622]|jgi:nucleoside-diphosphate-sugar epimerase|uniref:NAD-dependent epimerase/dehydratase family protein n=1 Tax=Flavobacterium sp. SORGH_AS_0622 TaxID=3041772 RepID=UPI002782FEE1|nr:NAD-dependent epimerase/dehydratase family protein [Flavobacterium sp. SORGH_AS_0622]MDQ1167507.1 nucleoside-diphosphate-sugar epimerase [Flavobacterium sp. SORGH_AS_0622]